MSENLRKKRWANKLSRYGCPKTKTSPNKIIMDVLVNLSHLFLKKCEWKSRRFHVNEQSYGSLTALLNKFNLTYKIITFEQPRFFYAQIEENANINFRLKRIIKLFNEIYDARIFIKLRGLPFINSY